MSEWDRHPDESARHVVSHEFHLAKYFSLTCLALFIAVTSVMCAGFYYISTRYIRMDAEGHAVPVTEWLSRAAFAEGRSIPAPGTEPTAQVNVSPPRAPLAGFQVSIIGRFWVSPEGRSALTSSLWCSE